jgi:alpha-glucosidase
VQDENQPYLWWQTGVIYQIYPRSFRDTTGNGIGDLAGVIDKIDYLSDVLGVDAIWLSPFYPSPMADFGYDVADYTRVHPLFGDLETFDALVTALHRRDMHLIIDFVPNHSSDQHPWFLESRSSRDNPKRDWYVWADAKPGGGPPNNWLSVFGGSSWEWDARTGQYYLHSFLKEQPDLNWRNSDLKAVMFDAIRFWLDREVDGFRIDVAHYIGKDPELRDNPLNVSGHSHIHRSLGDYDSIVHVHDQGHPFAHEVYREFRQILDSYSETRPRMSVGEIHIFDWARWASYYGEALDELHLPFNFSLLGVQWEAGIVRRLVDEMEAALPAGAWPNYVLGNHDDSRLGTRVGLAQARVAAVLLLTLRGTPTLYYGDEIGMIDVDIPPEKQVDPWGRNVPGQGRDPCRTPMQWDAGPSAGFSDAAAEDLWLPLAPDYRENNVARQLTDEESMLALYRRMLSVRRGSAALQVGAYVPLDGMPADSFCYLRRTSEEEVLVALNFSEEDIQLPALPLQRGEVAVSTHMDRGGEVITGPVLLRSHEGLVVLSK